MHLPGNGLILRIAKSQMLGFKGSEEDKIIKFSGGKALKLFDIIRAKGIAMTSAGEGFSL